MNNQNASPERETSADQTASTNPLHPVVRPRMQRRSFLATALLLPVIAPTCDETPGYVYDWRYGYSDDPRWRPSVLYEGMLGGPTAILCDGMMISGLITACRTGPNGFVERYVTDGSGEIQMTPDATVLLTCRIHGHVRMV